MAEPQAAGMKDEAAKKMVAEALANAQQSDAVDQAVSAEMDRIDGAAENSSQGRILLGPDIEIFPDKPRPDLASYGTKAFEAKAFHQTFRCFALLCDRGVIPRVTNVGTYKNIKNASILRLVETGVVWWAPENCQKFVLVFEMPGRRLMPDINGPFQAFSEDSLMANVIDPILRLLNDLRNTDMVHGAISLQNMFYTISEGSESVLLGECVSSPFSYAQHALFEPVTRAMAQRGGRGMGNLKDDLYSFGVCVALLARGVNLMAGKSEEEILHLKMEHGSYTAIVDRERLPAGISEFLRGVLSDDESGRWDIDEALKWLEGRRLSPRQPRVVLKANQPYNFRNGRYLHLRPLAYAFSMAPQEAAPIVEKEHFFQWIKKNFDDKNLHESYQNAAEIGKDRIKSNMGPDRLVARACIAMDPDAPLRYKGVSVTPRGFGNALVETMAKGGEVQPYGEILLHQLFDFWFSTQIIILADAVSLSSQLEKSRTFLTQKIAGYGLERIAYFLCKEAPCLSPQLKDFYVLSPGGILRALEVISKRSERPSTILDRHMTAFISVREPKMIDPHLGMVVSVDKSTQLVGTIRTLAAIQKRFKTGPMPSLGNWMITLVETALERFFDRDMRETLMKKANRQIDKGDLVEILEIVDNASLVQNDLHGFARARHEYMLLSRERSEHERNLKNKGYLGRGTGRQVSMLIASAVSALATIAVVMFNLSFFFRL